MSSGGRIMLVWGRVCAVVGRNLDALWWCFGFFEMVSGVICTPHAPHPLGGMQLCRQDRALSEAHVLT